MKKELKLKTLEEVRIYSDPYRIQIMNEFQNFNRPATIKEVADALQEVPAKVYYHAKKLESIGMLQLVDTKLINGITAKYYEPFKGQVIINKSGADEKIQQVFQSETEKLISNLYDENKKRFLQVSTTGRPKGNLTNTNVYLTEQEVEALFVMINEFCEQHDKSSGEDDRERFEMFFTLFTMRKQSPNKKNHLLHNRNDGSYVYSCSIAPACSSSV
ncbi:helix-turn-helix domain-containing protein [Paenibacillus sp. D2_2]|uniref:helix-turn-helix domain-containing protein n=1 Tax=Paenibacillus sp. D2_2 TaxID=3073092 RepID=UPI0028159464|nr:helix-turn-helix domain-containing protein [Paenibacillus sp. D2_2]WMT39960.1 helix-turn-helix domain-containing protein [Paenibacillus sp. D2_2]